MTSTHIVHPGPPYAPTGAGVPTIAASFAKTPVAPVQAPPGGLSTPNHYIATPGTTYALLLGHPNSTLHQRPVPGWQLPRRTWVYLPNPLTPTSPYPHRWPHPHNSTSYATTPSSNKTVCHYAYPCYGFSRTPVGISPCALFYLEFVFPTTAPSPVHTA